jgi:hypothetical protein
MCAPSDYVILFAGMYRGVKLDSCLQKQLEMKSRALLLIVWLLSMSEIFQSCRYGSWVPFPSQVTGYANECYSVVPLGRASLIAWSFLYFYLKEEMELVFEMLAHGHGMARPRVADGGDGLNFRKEAASVLN